MLTDEDLSTFGIVQNLAWGGAVPVIAERLGWDAQAVVSRIREGEAPRAAVRRFQLLGRFLVEGAVEVQPELQEALGEGLDEVLRAALGMLLEVLRREAEIVISPMPEDASAGAGDWVQTSVRVLSGEASYEIQQYIRPSGAIAVVNAFSAEDGGPGASGEAGDASSPDASRAAPPAAPAQRTVVEEHAWREIDPARNPPANPPGALGLLYDVPLTLRAELGRAQRRVEEVVALGPGSVIELERNVGEPVDIYANGQWVARGEVVVVEDNFGVRVTEIGSTQERASKLRLREGS